MKTEEIDALLDSLESHTGPVCSIRKLVGTPKQIYERAMTQQRNAAVIARALTRAGSPLSPSTIRRHQAGECATCRKK